MADCAEYGPGDETTATNLMKNLATNGATLISLFTRLLLNRTLAWFPPAWRSPVCSSILPSRKRRSCRPPRSPAYSRTYYKDPGMPGHIDDSHWYRVFSEAYYEAWQNGSGGVLRGSDSQAQAGDRPTRREVLGRRLSPWE